MRPLLFDFETAEAIPALVTVECGILTLRWTTWFEDVTIGDDTWTAEGGSIVSSIDCNSDGTENNADVLIQARAGGPVEPGDGARGRLDGWPVSVKFFDPADPEGTATEMMAGSIVGSVDEDANGVVVLAVSGQLIKTNVDVTEHYSLSGREDLGDDRCKIPILPADIQRGTHYVRPDIATGLQRVDDAYGRMLVGSPPSTYGNLYFECTVEGDTDPDEAPAYPEVAGDTVVDGTATFVARNAWLRSATGEALTEYEIMLDDLPDIRATDATWFVLGALYVKTGAMANFPKIPIRSWDPDTFILTLFLPVSVGDIPAGTEFEIAPGCDNTREMCFSRFNNINNLRAETFVPPPKAKF